MSAIEFEDAVFVSALKVAAKQVGDTRGISIPTDPL